MYFVLCRLYPFSLQPPRLCLGSYLQVLPVISLLCIAGADLPNRMRGKVSCDPKVSNLLWVSRYRTVLSESAYSNYTWCILNLILLEK
jgi:hypothetical protein